MYVCICVHTQICLHLWLMQMRPTHCWQLDSKLWPQIPDILSVGYRWHWPATSHYCNYVNTRHTHTHTQHITLDGLLVVPYPLCLSVPVHLGLVLCLSSCVRVMVNLRFTELTQIVHNLFMSSTHTHMQQAHTATHKYKYTLTYQSRLLVFHYTQVLQFISILSHIKWIFHCKFLSKELKAQLTPHTHNPRWAPNSSNTHSVGYLSTHRESIFYLIHVTFVRIIHICCEFHKICRSTEPHAHTLLHGQRQGRTGGRESERQQD